jgi:hypothetical protein
MKRLKTYLWCLGLTLVMAAPLWAEGLKEPVYPPYCWVQPPGSELWYQCDSEEAKDKACLNLMEQAMKAVNPYVPSVEFLKALPILQEDRATAGRILRLWDRAKNSCWPELRDALPQHFH